MRSRFIALLAVVLAAGLGLAAPAHALYPPGAEVTLKNNELAPGEEAKVKGKHLLPNTTYEILFEGKVLATVVTDGKGKFKSASRLPIDAAEGLSEIKVRQQGTNNTWQFLVKVDDGVDPVLHFDRTKNVKIKRKHLTPGDTYDIFFKDGKKQVLMQTVVVDADGKLKVKFKLPAGTERGSAKFIVSRQGGGDERIYDAQLTSTLLRQRIGSMVTIGMLILIAMPFVMARKRRRQAVPASSVPRL